MGNAGEDGAGFVGSAREVGAGLVEGIGLRLELFGVELQQEKLRVFTTVFFAMSASLAGFMALLFANLAIVATFWEQRLLVIGALVVGYLIMAFVFGWIVRGRIASRRMPFPATTAELRKDAEAIGVKR